MQTSPTKINAAYHAGQAAGEAVVPGVVFKGAAPAAESLGYEAGTTEFRSFLNGFMDALQVSAPAGVRCAAGTNVVIELCARKGGAR